MRRPRRNHVPAFKAKVALAAIKGDQTLAQLSERFDVYPNQINDWKAALLESAAAVFTTASDKREQCPDIKSLHAKIRQLALENDFFSRRARSCGRSERKTMIDPTHKLSIVRQAEVLAISRASGLLHAAADPGGRPGVDAHHRPAASGVSAHGCPDAARSTQSARLHGWPQTRSHPDAHDGH